MKKYDQFKGKRVLVWGLGLNDGGLGTVEFFLTQNVQLRVTDMKTEEELAATIKKLGRKRKKVEFILGEHRKKDFKWADLIIRNPAIKPDNEFLQYAKSLEKDIKMDMTLFHELKPCPSIGITGTRGKSTTTILIYEMLRNKMGKKVFVGGNIKKGALRGLDKLDKDSIAVLEISSFHLNDMGNNKISPDYSVITNMYRDHQNWYKDMNEYIDDKKNIYRYQPKDGICSINIDNDITEKFVSEIPSKAVTYSLENSSANYYTDHDRMLYENGEESLDLNEAKLEGVHNIYNITAAVSICRSIGLEWDYIKKTIKNFGGIPGRQEAIREINGIRFVNDTTATTVEAVNAALQRFGPKYEKKIIMIAGGVDKGLDYSFMKKDMEKFVKDLVLLEGSASEKIADQFVDSNIRVHKYYDNFKHAVNEAYRLAQKDDLVILAPAASSFNMFENEFDRGDKFNAIVKSLR